MRYLAFLTLALCLSLTSAALNATVANSASQPSGLPVWYSIQLATHSSLDQSSDTYEDFLENHPKYSDALRVEIVSSLYALRTGVYEDKEQARQVLQGIRQFRPDAYVVQAHIIGDRIVLPKDVSSIHAATMLADLASTPELPEQQPEGKTAAADSSGSEKVATPEENAAASAPQQEQAARKAASSHTRPDTKAANMTVAAETAHNGGYEAMDQKTPGADNSRASKQAAEAALTQKPAETVRASIGDASAPQDKPQNTADLASGKKSARPDTVKNKAPTASSLIRPEPALAHADKTSDDHSFRADVPEKRALAEKGVEKTQGSDTPAAIPTKDPATTETAQSAQDDGQTRTAKAAGQPDSTPVGKKTSVLPDMVDTANAAETKVVVAPSGDTPSEPVAKGASESTAKTGKDSMSKAAKQADAQASADNRTGDSPAPFSAAWFGTGLLKKIVLLLLAAGSIAILLQQLRQKRPDERGDVADYHQPKLDGPPKLKPELEQRLSDNCRQATLTEENLVAVNRGTQSVFVTSAFRSEGKTVTALSMVDALSTSSGNNTLLIDGSATNPDLHGLFGTDQGPGLVDVLAGDLPVHEAVQETAYPRLSLLPFGNAGHKGQLDDPAPLKALVDSLKSSYKYIIFDGSALFDSPNTALLAAGFDGTLLAVQAERTKWEVVQNNREKLQRVDGKVLGIVLTKRNFYIPRFLYGKI